uniref:Uncharacterized protein n=1 Tax=Caenorhabditis tropicalis TaxID=1561998 RepID=A0A1I7UD54_9PELO
MDSNFYHRTFKRVRADAQLSEAARFQRLPREKREEEIEKARDRLRKYLKHKKRIMIEDSSSESLNNIDIPGTKEWLEDFSKQMRQARIDVCGYGPNENREIEDEEMEEVEKTREVKKTTIPTKKPKKQGRKKKKKDPVETPPSIQVEDSMVIEEIVYDAPDPFLEEEQVVVEEVMAEEEVITERKPMKIEFDSQKSDRNFIIREEKLIKIKQDSQISNVDTPEDKMKWSLKSPKMSQSSEAFYPPIFPEETSDTLNQTIDEVDVSLDEDNAPLMNDFFSQDSSEKCLEPTLQRSASTELLDDPFN